MGKKDVVPICNIEEDDEAKKEHDSKCVECETLCRDIGDCLNNDCFTQKDEPREDYITEQLKRCEVCKRQIKILNNYEFISDFLMELKSIEAFISIIKEKLEKMIK